MQRCIQIRMLRLGADGDKLKAAACCGGFRYQSHLKSMVLQ
jgi:hypothetical protein